ncbi:hypothetical protein C8Q77DRAFT_1070004 [Trametes polyzona]|nr:hypothetical protein C8Q77DRAFT_1070004 [Trametes polyzona]
MTSKKTAKCKKEPARRPDPETAKQQVVKALKKVPIQSLTHASPPGVYVPPPPSPCPSPLPPPAVQRRPPSQQSARPTDDAEYATGRPPTSPPLASSQVRTPSTLPTGPDCASPTGNVQPLPPNTFPDVHQSFLTSHEGGRHDARPRHHFAHTTATVYPTHDNPRLVREPGGHHGGYALSGDTTAAIAPCDPHRSSAPTYRRYPHSWTIPSVPPVTSAHFVDVRQATLSEPNGSDASIGEANSRCSGDLTRYQGSWATAHTGGWRADNAFVGLNQGPDQFGCAVPGAPPLHNHTRNRDNEAARAAQLRDVSSPIWSYGGEAYDQRGYTYPDGTVPVHQTVGNCGTAQGGLYPPEGDHHLGGLPQNAGEASAYVPFGAGLSAVGSAATYASYGGNQSALVSGGYLPQFAASAVDGGGTPLNPCYSEEGYSASWYSNDGHVPDLASSPGTPSSASEESVPTHFETEPTTLATRGYEPTVATVPMDGANAFTILFDEGGVYIPWQVYHNMHCRPFCGMKKTIDDCVWAAWGQQQ